MNNPPNPRRQPAEFKARTLAAWLPLEEGERPADGPGSTDWLTRAAAKLAMRPPSPDQAGVVRPLPAILDDHVEQLRQSPDARRMFDDGWAVALVVDLRRLVSAQRSVRVDYYRDAARTQSDIRAIARLTLPLERPSAQIATEFDPALQAWRLTSPSPNMRITGRFADERRAGAFDFGFTVEVLTSFLSVAEYRRRLILRDGYHRAYRLIRAGIFTAPAFVRAYRDDEPVFAGETLPAAIWTGDRPPLLGDFGDDTVAHDSWLPETRTTLYVGAVPPGLALDARANR